MTAEAAARWMAGAAARTGVAPLLVLVAAALLPACPAYPLIEAAGVDPFTPSGWDLVIAGDHLCGHNSSGAVLLSTNSSEVRLLNGPTPHTVGTGTIVAPNKLSTNWVAGVAVGSRILVFTNPPATASSGSGGTLAVLTIAPGCGSIASVQWATLPELGEPEPVTWVGAALAEPSRGGKPSTATVFSIGAAAGGAGLVAIDLNFGTSVQATVRHLAAIDISGTCVFKGLAASSRGKGRDCFSSSFYEMAVDVSLDVY